MITHQPVMFEGRIWLYPTSEVRRPNKGEYFYCGLCKIVELCYSPEICSPGVIYTSVNPDTHESNSTQAILHRLWSRALESGTCDKSLWMELERRIHDLERMAKQK